MEKLTYYQICSLAAQGRFSEIPSGYNIVWIGEEPNKRFSETVDGNKIVFTRNSCPQPTSIKVTGEVVPVVPHPYEEMREIDDEPEMMEYGDVFIPTRFILSELDMIYGESRLFDVNRWRNDVMDTMYSGHHIKKEDFTFDMDIPIKMCEISLKNVMLCSLVEENYMMKAELVYDWFEINEKNHQDS